MMAMRMFEPHFHSSYDAHSRRAASPVSPTAQSSPNFNHGDDEHWAEGIDLSFRRLSLVEDKQKKSLNDGANASLSSSSASNNAVSATQPFKTNKKALHMAGPQDVQRMRIETKKLL